MKFFREIKAITFAILVAGALSTSVSAETNLDLTESALLKHGAWEGFYVAGSYGYSKDNSNLSSNYNYPALVSYGDSPFSSSNTANSKKYNPGIQFGYNWKIDSYILGLEADLSPSAIKQSGCSRVESAGGVCGDDWYGQLKLAAETNYKGAVKLRFGYQISDFMVYATGGVAYANISNTLNVNCPSGCSLYDGNAFTSTTTVSKNALRFAYGLGGEYRVYENWKLGMDYFYFTLPDLSQAVTHAASYGQQDITSTISNSYSQLKFRLIYSF